MTARPFVPRPERVIPALIRLLDKTTVMPHGCWTFTGRETTGGGYAKVSHYEGRRFVQEVGHRVVYEAFRGPIPAGLQLDHLCRNRKCLNPDHLEAVTCRENLLRGKTHAAANAAKTACPRGHAYEPGRRKCLICRVADQRRYLARKRGN